MSSKDIDHSKPKVNKIFIILFFSTMLYLLFISIDNTTEAVSKFNSPIKSEVNFNDTFMKIDKIESFHQTSPLLTNFQLDSLLIAKQSILPDLVKEKRKDEVLFTLLEIKNIQIAILNRKIN